MHSIPKNKFQWNLNQNTTIFIHQNQFQNVFCTMLPILPWPQLKLSWPVLTTWQLVQTPCNQAYPIHHSCHSRTCQHCMSSWVWYNRCDPLILNTHRTVWLVKGLWCLLWVGHLINITYSCNTSRDICQFITLYKSNEQCTLMYGYKWCCMLQNRPPYSECYHTVCICHNSTEMCFNINPFH